MGLFNWLGFGRPRDEPEMDGGASLPEVTDRVRDSGQTFFFGTASSGAVSYTHLTLPTICSV